MIGGAVVVLAVTAAAGCGGDTEIKVVAEPTRTVTVVEPAADAGSPPRARRRAPAFRSCDANIRVRKRTTTCAFAQNVFWEFWQAQQRGDDLVTAYSPVTGREYSMDCDAGLNVACTGGDGSEVRFPMSAVDAYDAEQAYDYACNHKVGADDVSGCVDEELEPSSSSDCDPNYAGACLDPDSYDYDCDGGDGDGPDYTGQVEVVGEDVYGLDRDGDGIACDW